MPVFASTQHVYTMARIHLADCATRGVRPIIDGPFVVGRPELGAVERRLRLVEHPRGAAAVSITSACPPRLRPRFANGRFAPYLDGLGQAWLNEIVRDEGSFTDPNWPLTDWP
jgi:hypothetical protein